MGYIRKHCVLHKQVDIYFYSIRVGILVILNQAPIMPNFMFVSVCRKLGFNCFDTLIGALHIGNLLCY